jgi:hypothetical protein
MSLGVLMLAASPCGAADLSAEEVRAILVAATSNKPGKLLRTKAVVVSVTETPGRDFGRHGRERRAQANRCRSVESGLGDVRTGG